MNARHRPIQTIVALALAIFALSVSDTAAAADPIRFMLHGGWGPEPPTEDYLRFVEQVKPDIVIIGVFDQQLYATSARAETRGKQLPPPAQLLAQWKDVAQRLHQSGIRLIGHMELDVLSDRPSELAQGTGWFGYYDQHWDEKLLGQRPTKTAVELLEEPDFDRHVEAPSPVDRDTIARCGCRVNLRALNACINKPAWRAVQKAMIKTAISHGVDGFITNRNYVNHCACPHCAHKFRRWLTDQYTLEQLRARFGIGSLDEYPLCMVGAHRDHATVPPELVLEKQRFAKHMVKEFFDEVYGEYGRGQKPDLFIAQWNHMGCFDELHLDRGHLPPSTRTSFAHAAADERWGLPLDSWGKGESLFWYCNWGTTQNTILEQEYAGDTVLYGKLLRALARGQPYTINKYDFYRPRNMMAEAAALGYVTNAIDTPWRSEEDRAVVLRYFSFLKKYDHCYRSADNYAEVGLVFPWRAIQAGDSSPLEYVEAAGRCLIREHVLFDMVPDELLDQTSLEGYRALVLSAPEYLSDRQRKVLAEYVARGGKLLFTPVAKEDRARGGAASDQAQQQATTAARLELAAVTVESIRTNHDAFHNALQQTTGKHLSNFEAPWTVEVQAYRQMAAGRIVLHLVNYNHREKAPGKSVVAQEAPIATEPVKVRLRLPEGFRVKAVSFASPDDEKSHSLEYTQHGDLLELQTPAFLVYGLCVVQDDTVRR